MQTNSNSAGPSPVYCKLVPSVIITLSLLALCPNTARAQGAITNGWLHTGTIAPIGDSDSWTFSANDGDRIVIRVGEITQSGNFTPRVRLQNPSAVLIASAQNATGAEIAVTATNTGTFTVIVDDAVGTTATGTYRLSLAKSPGAVFVASGDEGGPMTNGTQHSGTNLVGDLDVWTFSANAGDGIVLRMGTTAYNPWIRLYGPDGVLVGQAFDGSVGVRDTDLRIQATNSGTFTVIASSLNATAGGDYILTLAHAPGDIFVSPGDQGGPMTNAYKHTGTIDVGDLDVWTFSANAGDAIVLRMGSTGYNPWIRIFSPNGTYLGQAADGSVGVRDVDLRIQATNSGTFTVVLGSWSQNGTGAYILTLAHAPEAITVSPGDQGGPMTNAFKHTGTIDVGDLDVWSFSANAGDAIVLRMGSTGYNPWIRIFSPNGTYLGQAADGSVGVRDVTLQIQATNTGTYTVVVGSWSQNGTGAFILTLAHVPASEGIVVSPGDQGGPMTNAFQHSGTIDTGDMDVWSFSANNGDAIVLRMGSVGYNPWIRIFNPNGVMVGQAVDGSVGVRDADLRIQATNSGTFTVVAASWSQNGNGAYILTLAHAPPGSVPPDAIVVSPGDQGGPMTNGLLHDGFLEIGDLDGWSFSANIGDSIALRMGTTNAYNPWIRLFSPTGVLVAQGFDGSVGIRDAELRIQSTNSGTFTVVAASLSQNGTGNYILTLSRSPGAISVSPGDEGGAMANGFQYTGSISVGDMDVWGFPVCRGNVLALTCEKLTGGSGFSPRIRLFGPNGALLVTAINATLASMNYPATNSGAFTLVVDGANLNHTGTYRLTGNGFSEDGLRLCLPLVSGGKLDVTGIGGLVGTNGVLFTHTNVTAPVASWTAIRTNPFDQFGVFTYTNSFNAGEPKRFFILRTP